MIIPTTNNNTLATLFPTYIWLWSSFWFQMPIHNFQNMFLHSFFADSLIQLSIIALNTSFLVLVLVLSFCLYHYRTPIPLIKKRPFSKLAPKRRMWQIEKVCLVYVDRQTRIAKFKTICCSDECLILMMWCFRNFIYFSDLH